MTAIYKRPTICIPASKRNANFVRDVFARTFKGTHFEIVGGPVETGRNVGKGFNAWFVTYEPGTDDDFDTALLEIFDCIEHRKPGRLTLPNGSFWHLCPSAFAHHNKVTEPLVEPEIHFGDFE